MVDLLIAHGRICVSLVCSHHSIELFNKVMIHEMLLIVFNLYVLHIHNHGAPTTPPYLDLVSLMREL